MRLQRLMFFILVSVFSCNTKPNQTHDSGENLNSHIDDKQGQMQDYNQNYFSSHELAQIAKKEGIDMMFKRGDTLQIIADLSLMRQPFGYESFKDSLQDYHGGIFKIGMLQSDEEKKKKYRLRYQESVIILLEMDESLIPKNAEMSAEYHYRKPSLAKVLSAEIKDKEVVLTNNIHVGMGRNDFFSALFPKTTSNEFKNINVVELLHILEESSAPVFFFEEDILVRIEIK